MSGYLKRNLVAKSKTIREKLFFVLTLTLVLCLGTLAKGGQNENKVEVYFECVVIRTGDTLWEIAREYKTENEKIEHMITHIMEVNGMRSENIRSGESIIVPIKK